MSDPVETCGFTLSEWQHHYQTRPAGERLACVSATIETLIAGLNPDDNAWLYLATPAQREQQYRQLAQLLAAVAGDLSCLPLFGVPFAIKDNIDVGGWPTSAACPAFTYQAAADATVVANLRAAGASPSVKPTSTSSLPGWWAPAHLMARWSTASTAATSAAVPAPAPPRWWRAVWCRSRWAPTPPVRGACPPGSTTSSG